MRVFISVSGSLSTCIGKELSKIIKLYFPEMTPWIADEEIHKGQAWRTVLAESLSDVVAGLIVLTSQNQHKPWIQFESGAIAAKSNFQRVGTLCVNMSKAEVSGPLSSFQHTELTSEDLIALAQSIIGWSPNSRDSETSVRLAQKFSEELLREARNCKQRCDNHDDSLVPTKQRSTEDLLTEILNVSRETNAAVSHLASQGSPTYLVTGVQGIQGATGPVTSSTSTVFTSKGSPTTSPTGIPILLTPERYAGPPTPTPATFYKLNLSSSSSSAERKPATPDESSG